MSVRDFQRKALYDAESEFQDLDGFGEFSTIREAQTFANNILGGHTFLKLSPYQRPVVVSAHPRSRDSWVQDNNMFIELGSDGMNRITVIHEMAHVLTTRLFGDSRVADHGPEFCSIERMIVKEVLPLGQALLWEDRVIAHGIRFNTETVLAKIRKPHFPATT